MRGIAIASSNAPSCYVGLDLGGTRIKAGVIDAACTVIANSSVQTPSDSRPDAVIAALDRVARRVVQDAGREWTDVRGIGIGVPGLIDSGTGIVRSCVNLNDWKDVALRELASQAMGKPTVVENDANAAAFGAYRHASKRRDGLKHFALITLGTGIGAGVVLNGRVFRGGSGLAGEVGHMVVEPDGRPCACGQRGCLEQYASATAIVQRARDVVATDTATTLRAKAIEGTLDTRDVFDAAGEHDAAAQRLVQEVTRYLAIACVNLCRVVDLQAIVIGGGVAGAGDALIRPLRDAFRSRNWDIAGGSAPTVSATELANDAGFIGAAALALADSGDRPLG